MPRFLATAILVSVLAGSATADSADTLKLSVLADGQVLADGRPVKLDELKLILDELANDKGTVLYYRENSAEEEPHPNAMTVIQLIVENQLPIALSTEPDFSTV